MTSSLQPNSTRNGSTAPYPMVPNPAADEAGTRRKDVSDGADVEQEAQLLDDGIDYFAVMGARDHERLGRDA
jgi:hypothetical protein